MEIIAVVILLIIYFALYSAMFLEVAVTASGHLEKMTQFNCALSIIAIVLAAGLISWGIYMHLLAWLLMIFGVMGRGRISRKEDNAFTANSPARYYLIYGFTHGSKEYEGKSRVSPACFFRNKEGNEVGIVYWAWDPGVNGVTEDIFFVSSRLFGILGTAIFAGFIFALCLGSLNKAGSYDSPSVFMIHHVLSHK